MTWRVASFALGIVVLITPFAMASDTPPEIRKVPLPRECHWTRDGAVLFQELCSVCHGESGLGNGPAAMLLTPPPADLSLLSSNNGGDFPSVSVLHSISGSYHSSIPGSEMPGWEDLFNQTTGDRAAARHRVYNLTQYLKEIQVAQMAER